MGTAKKKDGSRVNVNGSARRLVVCRDCGKEFMATSNNSKMCPDCAKKARAAYYRKRRLDASCKRDSELCETVELAVACSASGKVERNDVVGFDVARHLEGRCIVDGCCNNAVGSGFFCKRCLHYGEDLLWRYKVLNDGPWRRAPRFVRIAK